MTPKGIKKNSNSKNTTMDQKQEQLTIEQAINQGYTHYFHEGDGFQATKILSRGIDDNEWSRGLELVSQESYNPSGIDAESLIELIADHIEDRHADDTGDDTTQVYEALMTIDPIACQSLIDVIEQKLSGLHYYRSSGIKLVKE